jgi:hypothetical protein
MRRLVSLAFVLATIAAPLAAQAKPTNYSGKWVLDPKSNGSAMTVVTSDTMIVVQDAKTIKIDQHVSTAMGNQTTSLTFNLDGSESKNDVSMQGTSLSLSSKASWDGPVLVVKTTTAIQGQPLTQSERWMLDANGKTLRMQRNADVGGQTMSVTMTFIKQS